MKIRNPLSKKKPHPLATTPVAKPKEKKDYFNAMVILMIGLMIGALIAYILFTNAPG